MGVCRVCSAGPVESTLALGPQPVSSHFAAAGQQVVTHDLSLGVCLACGVVQLVEPFPFRDLVPPYDWITYREPEEHLDACGGNAAGAPCDPQGRCHPRPFIQGIAARSIGCNGLAIDAPV